MPQKPIHISRPDNLGFHPRLLSRRSDNGLPGLDSRRCFVYELLLTREKFYEEADYVWRRTGTGPQSSGHGCVRDSVVPQYRLDLSVHSLLPLSPISPIHHVLVMYGSNRCCHLRKKCSKSSFIKLSRFYRM